MRVLSGIQSSGKLHIGNYFGMIKPMVDHQENSDLYAFIANYHALTSVFDAEKLREQTLNAAIDFLASGIDPQKSTFWVQSDVPEVTELTWLLSNTTGMGLLERAHSYKDKVAKGIVANLGLFSYPVLMAADILAFGSEKVPVGKDQKQHIEIARDIAIRFNSTYGETFVLPEEEIDDNVATIPGLDGLKMSKSYGNTIEIFTTEKELRKKVMSIKTDTTPVDEPKPIEGNALFDLYSIFLDQKGKEELKERFTTPGLKYGEVKKELADVIWEYFAPYRERRQMFENDKGQVLSILKDGAAKAKGTASQYLELARKNAGLNYWD